MDEEEQENKHVLQQDPIITPRDVERWPLLEMVSQECDTPITPADEQAILEMDTLLDVMDDQAAGLAAVQIGVPRRIFLLRNGVGEDGAFNNAYINPTIISKSSAVSKKPEACLSLPGVTVMIPRPKKLTLQYLNLNGEVCEEVFTGFWARAVCHEMSHLNGILITKYLEEQFTNKQRRSKSGMVLDDATKKRISKRRAKKKRAKVINKKKR